jgi:8-oxo-dGTP diphosphatase
MPPIGKADSGRVSSGKAGSAETGPEKSGSGPVDRAGGRTGARSDRAARPKVAVDTVLFAVESGRLKTYLVQLRRGAGSGRWAFAGGLVRMGEMLDEAARRELFASTGIRGAYLEQLFTFGDPSRDPRTHVVSVAYMALIGDPRSAAAPGSKYLDGRWFEVSALPALAYDHQQMAEYALGRLKAKLEYTNIACNLLPETFTFAELEALYAMILKRPIDRRNFRRRILSMGILRRLPATRRGAHRPAALYSFARRDPQVVEML